MNTYYLVETFCWEVIKVGQFESEDAARAHWIINPSQRFSMFEAHEFPAAYMENERRIAERKAKGIFS